jgi:MFS family permease
MSPDNTRAQAPAKGRSFTLFLLIVVYALNFLDRQILSILKEPIAAELHLNDAQLGWMGGLAFGLLYSVLAIPVAWLADRYSRVWIMTGALAIWSGFTALCGLTGSFPQMFLARMGVGIGEAGGTPPAYSVIADLYPPKQRARALSLYSLAIPLGSAAGILFGGLMAATVNWRWAFLVIGGIGVLMAPVLRLLVKDPVRGHFDVPQTDQLSFAGVVRLAASKPTFWLIAFGTGFASLVGYGFLYWFPTFLTRSLHMDIVSRSLLFATAYLISGIVGIIGGGQLGDRLGPDRKFAYPLIPAIAFIISAPLYALCVMAKTPQMAFVFVLIPQALGLMWIGPLLAATQHMAPANSRTQMSALFLLITNLIGLCAGPYFFGKVSDLLKPHYGADSMKWAFIIGLGFYIVAAVLMALASRTIKKDWLD